MAGKTKHPSYDELAWHVASLREQVRALKAELHRLRAENARLRGKAPTGPGEPTGEEATAAPPRWRKAPPRWAKANVVRVRVTRPRKQRALVARAQVVEHVVLERRCPGCGARCRGAMPDLSEQVGAQRRVSWRVAARAARPAYDGFLAEARASPVGHRDETGWREDGQNGWVWTLTTPTVRLFRCSRSRGGAVARALLGPEAAGVIVSDCYTAYDQLDGRHQRCWAHLPREIHQLTEQPPDDAGLHAWAEGMPALFTEAVAWTGAAGGALPAARERARRRVETAERALRPLVVARKISGGSRSKHGSQTRMTLQSVIATWDLRGLDPLAEMLALLRAPRTPLLEFPLV